MKTDILCQNVNPNSLSNLSYIEAMKMHTVCTLLVRKTAHE